MFSKVWCTSLSSKKDFLSASTTESRVNLSESGFFGADLGDGAELTKGEGTSLFFPFSFFPFIIENLAKDSSRSTTDPAFSNSGKLLSKL